MSYNTLEQVLAKQDEIFDNLERDMLQAKQVKRHAPAHVIAQNKRMRFIKDVEEEEGRKRVRGCEEEPRTKVYSCFVYDIAHVIRILMFDKYPELAFEPERFTKMLALQEHWRDEYRHDVKIFESTPRFKDNRVDLRFTRPIWTVTVDEAEYPTWNHFTTMIHQVCDVAQVKESVQVDVFGSL